MRRALAALALLAAAAAAAWAAEPLPAPMHTSINDFAGVLTDADTRTLDEALIALHGRTGIEGTVVTLPDRARYGDPTLEGFATRLFNAWGVGDAGRNDGFMVLLAMAERELRIELGAGYPAAADIRAGDIIRNVMVPRLRAGEASAALREGTLAVIEAVALPQAGARPVPPSREGGGLSDWLLRAAVFGVFAVSGLGLVRGLLRRRREAACPACGARTTASERLLADTLPGGAAATRREVTRRCPSCGWTDSRILPVPVVGGGREGGRRWRGSRRGGGGGGGFGGGRSGGGGASGRW